MTSRAPKRSATKKASPTKDPLARLFDGKKSKWVPLFRRLAARLNTLRGLVLTPQGTAIRLTQSSSVSPQFGRLRVTTHGLELDFAFQKGSIRSSRLKPTPKSTPKPLTHRTILTHHDEIDEELMAWLKSAMAQSRVLRD